MIQGETEYQPSNFPLQTPISVQTTATIPTTPTVQTPITVQTTATIPTTPVQTAPVQQTNYTFVDQATDDDKCLEDLRKYYGFFFDSNAEQLLPNQNEQIVAPSDTFFDQNNPLDFFF